MSLALEDTMGESQCYHVHACLCSCGSLVGVFGITFDEVLCRLDANMEERSKHRS